MSIWKLLARRSAKPPKPTREEIKEAIIKMCNAEFDCGEWQDDDDEYLDYGLLADAAEAARARLESLIERLYE